MASVAFSYVRLEDLVQWLENKLSEKYSLALEGMEKRFIPVISQIESILYSSLEIHNILKESSDLAAGKVYLDNIM